MLTTSKLEQAGAWSEIWDQCVQLGMDTGRASTGLGAVKTFISELNVAKNENDRLRRRLETHSLSGYAIGAHKFWTITNENTEHTNDRSQRFLHLDGAVGAAKSRIKKLPLSGVYILQSVALVRPVTPPIEVTHIL